MPLIDQTSPWWRLAAWCSNRACKRRPRVRVSCVMMEYARTLEPDVILFNYECHGYNCGTVYEVPAAAFQHAEPDPAASRAA